MNTFIIGILAFLLTIFPSCGSLQYQYQARTFDGDAIRSSIISAIETRDVSTLQSMMCRNIKNNIEDLPDKIGELIDAIDGEIIEWRWDPSGGYDNANYGKRISQQSWAWYITTSKGTYYLGLVWEVANNFAPEETGIRNIGVTNQQNLSLLALITAPESIRHGM